MARKKNEENVSGFTPTEFTEPEGRIKAYSTREKDYIVVNDMDADTEVYIPVQSAESVGKMILELVTTLNK